MNEHPRIPIPCPQHTWTLSRLAVTGYVVQISLRGSRNLFLHATAVSCSLMVNAPALSECAYLDLSLAPLAPAISAVMFVRL